MRRRWEERGGTGRGQFYGERPATVGRQEGGIREATGWQTGSGEARGCTTGTVCGEARGRRPD
jgi:hypothetical protein